jgi:hypothetical protein
MKHDVRTILETPFTADQIKQRKGLWGKTLDYIEGHTVIQRLNDAFESDWGFTVVEHHILDDEVVVLGRIHALDVTKEQFGSSHITRDASNGKTLCLGDDLKAAATDALKKCATLIGVGLSLYSETSAPQKRKPSSKASEPDKHPPVKVTTPVRGQHTDSSSKLSNGNNGNGNGRSNGYSSNIITPKQKKYCLTLGRRHNLNASQVDRLCVDNFTVPFEELTKTQASDLIALLTE